MEEGSGPYQFVKGSHKASMLLEKLSKCCIDGPPPTLVLNHLEPYEEILKGFLKGIYNDFNDVVPAIFEPYIETVTGNAGYGFLNTFDKISLKEHVDFINVLSTSVVTLTHSFLLGMLDREFGRIINISSISGLTSPANASGGMYSGVKSMVIKFSEGIHKEYSHKNVYCCAVCPGFTHTEFHENMKEFKNSIPSFMWMTSKEVAKESYEASMQGKELYVNGFFNRFLLFVMRILPKWLNNLYVKSLMRKRH